MEEHDFDAVASPTELGREVECRRCRTAFFADESRPDRRDDRPREATPDGSGFALGSLLLGLGSIFTFPLCGAGAVFGLGGLLTGFGGLQSRRRGMSIAGLVFSLAGLILSVGMIGLIGILMSATSRPVPPKADGTQPPFARNLN